MYAFHEDKIRYFDMQRQVTDTYVIPYILPYLKPQSHILEIGCAEAGVLKAFLDRGHTAVGIELNENRAHLARQFLADYISEGRALIINKNIYDIQNPKEELGQLFDVIVLKDVIEHIPQQEKFIASLSQFLTPNGVVFFAYPPWWMPFGGHQQICSNKILRVLPWFHLLPMPLYKGILKICGEQAGVIKELHEIKETGIIIEKMKSLIIKNNFSILEECFWLINPIYSYKFALKPRRLWSLLSAVPYLRNFYTTAHYLVFSKITKGEI